MSAASVASPHAKVNFGALPYYWEYRGLYRDIWSVLGRTWTNLKDEAQWSMETIPGGQHGELKITLTDEQRIALVPLFTRMRLFQGCHLLGGEYSELEITGAKFPAMCERAKLVIDRLKEQAPNKKVSFGRIIYQLGERFRQDIDGNGKLFDGSVEQIYASLTDKVKAHPWVVDQMKAGLAFNTEYHLGILSLIIATDGDIQVEAIEPNNEEDSRWDAWCTMRLPDGTPVYVLNGPAVQRRHGPPRPTTTSNTQYRLRHFPPIRGGKIVTVSGKVHWRRVIRDFEWELHQNYPDITVYGLSIGVGGEAIQGVLNNALGEVVFMLQKAVVELDAITG